MKPAFPRIAMFAAALLACAAAPVSAEDAAKMLSGEGTVEYRPAETAPWQALVRETVLPEGAEVRTLETSTCTLLAGKDFSSALRLKERTHVRLVQREPFRAEVKSGRVLSMVGRLGSGSSFSILSPTAIASARGTGWGQETDRVEVFEDTVDVQTSGGDSGQITEGNGVEIGEDGQLGDPYGLSGDDWNEWNEFKEDTQEDLSGEGGSDGPAGSGGEEDFLDLKDDAGQLGKDDSQTDQMTKEPEKGKDDGGSLSVG